jgi:hypothetical protein
MTDSIYSPLSKDTSTRLLVLHPGQFEDPVHCDLNEIDLDDSPEYDALSYTWGDSKKETMIFVNDQPVLVRTNLYNFLRRLRHVSHSETLWVDALSISQSDLNEKGQQVAMIGRIFQQAICTHTWTGEHRDNSEALFREDPISLRDSPNAFWRLLLIFFVRIRHKYLTPLWPMLIVAGMFASPALGSALHIYSNFPRTQSSLFTICLFALLFTCFLIWVHALPRGALTQRERWYVVPEWRAFLRRPYWKRTWIIQEIALSKRVIVHCGDDKMDWEDLVEPKLGHGHHSSGRGISNNAHYGKLLDGYVAYLHEVRSAILEFGRASIASIPLLAWDARSTRCENQLDRIYAILAMSHLDPADVQFTSDYTLSVPELFVTINRAFKAIDEGRWPLFKVLRLIVSMRLTWSQAREAYSLSIGREKIVFVIAWILSRFVLD